MAVLIPKHLSPKQLSPRSISTIAASATIAAAMFMAVPALVNARVSAPSDKADLADAQDCELQGWPYYARACLRDHNKNAGGRAVKARLVTTDQIERARTRDAGEAAAGTSTGEAPADWMMTDRDIRTYISAGDFIRRTVR
jgi:hypothetical protein